MLIILNLLLGIVIGWGLNTLISRHLALKANKKTISDITEKYSNVLNNIKTNKASFKNRINQAVYISTNIKEHGDVELVYLIDKKDVAIFKSEKCIYTSHSIDAKIITDIITSIRMKFMNQINDVVEVAGLLFSKTEFEKKFNINIGDIQKQQKKFQEEQKSDIQKIIDENSQKLSVDDILDKISKVGYENLTKSEKEFLNKTNNG